MGLEVARNKSGISLCQCYFALDLLSEAGFLGCKPHKTLMYRSLKLSHKYGTPLPDPGCYKRLVGRLLYLTTTRPDLSFAVQQLSEFTSCPTTQHFQATHRVLRYIKGSPGKGLFFPSFYDFQLKAFSDSDWAGCVDSRQSITGFTVYLDHCLISWRSKK